MADEIRIRFACQHPAHALGSDADITSVECGICGERRVQSVVAPPPRFLAKDCNQAQMGPLVTHA